MNHYDWLEHNLLEFARTFEVEGKLTKGAIAAHGDKCYSYRSNWEAAGIAFPVGVAIYLLSYHRPYSESVRDTPGGWVAPDQWVIEFFNANQDKLAQFLSLPDPEEAPGSRADFIRRVEHARHYLEDLPLDQQSRKDLNKILYGYEPDGRKPLTKDSPKRRPNWRMLEALKRQ